MSDIVNYQAKVLMGTIAVLLDDLPKPAQYHLSRVCVNLSEAIMKDEGLDALTVGEVTMLATDDLMQHWIKDDGTPTLLRELAEMIAPLLAECDQPAKETDESIWLTALEDIDTDLGDDQAS